MTTSTRAGDVDGPERIGRVAIADLLRKSAARFPDRIALTDGTERIAFSHLDADVDRAVNLLTGKGLVPGDKVATLCGNSIAFVKVIFAIHRAGLVWIPINTMISPEEITYILDHAEVKFAIGDAEEMSKPGKAACFSKRAIPTMCIARGTANAASSNDIETAIRAESPAATDVTVGDRELAMIIYTSGTTAKPKGVMHSNLSVVMATMSNCIEMQLSQKDGISGQFPLFHCAGHVLMLSYLTVGGRVALMRGFDPLVCMEAIQRDKLTIFVGLPMMYQAMLDHPRLGDFDLSSLRTCIYTMAPMSQPLLERAMKELCPNFVLSSGQTEMYPITMISRPDVQLERFGNYWGEPSVVNERAIMDENGTLLPPGEVGELVHRGPNVMMGYYKDPDATLLARRHGWHHTGDLAKVVENGELLFLDRTKDVIKSGGENVASIRIEEVLLSHPSIKDAAVVGLPHPQWGEAVSAFVCLKDDANFDADDIIRHCRLCLGGFQVPKLIRRLDELPKTSTGKLRKVELRDIYRNAFSSKG
jgi:long-chain acyl-CoA synthetase